MRRLNWIGQTSSNKNVLLLKLDINLEKELQFKKGKTVWSSPEAATGCVLYQKGALKKSDTVVFVWTLWNF